MSSRNDLMIRSSLAALAMLLTTAASGPALADDDGYHTGMTPSDPSEVQGLPTAPVYTDVIPARVDLSRYLPPVGDQGGIGSCTAWATGYAARALYVSWLEGRDVRRPENVPSPEFIYDSINMKPGDCDGGSSILKVMFFLMKGSPSKADAPYDDEAMLKAQCVRPSAAENGLKRDFFIETPFLVDRTSVDMAKAELTQGHPVVIGFQLGHSFKVLPAGMAYQGDWRGYYAKSFQENVNHHQSGGHAVTLVGFDDDRQAFKLVNSWSTDWSDRGFGWLSYKAYIDPSIVDEAWTMRPAHAH
jgi:C1A family cysteine protease